MAHLHMQVYRPVCGDNQILFPPDGCGSCPSTFVCIEFPNFMIPQFQLISETIVASTVSPSSLHQVLPQNEIKVKKYDVIGFQQNGTVIECAEEGATDIIYQTNTHQWLAVGEFLPSHEERTNKCLIRVLYSLSQIIKSPELDTLTAGIISYKADLRNPISHQSLHCNVTVEEPIKDLQLINVNVPSGEVTLLAFVMAGTNVVLNWTLTSTVDNTTGQCWFVTECPANIETSDFSVCNELTNNSGKSVAIFQFVFQSCKTYIINLTAYNRIDIKNINQTLQVVDEDAHIMLSSQPGLLEIYKDCEITFSAVSSNCLHFFQWTVDGKNQQQNVSEIRYTFETEGVHNVSVVASDIIETFNVTVKETPWKLVFTVAPKFVLIEQDTEFMLSLIGTIGKFITVTWDFGDNGASEVTNFTLQSTETTLFKDHSFLTKDVFIVNVSVRYDSCFLNAVHSLRSGSLVFQDILLPDCTPVHQSVYFNAVVSAAADIQFDVNWIFGDDTDLKTSNTSVSHAYHMPGPFTVTAFVVSDSISQNKSKLVCVQEPLSGITLQNNGPTLLGQETLFTLNFISGSNYEFYWNNDTRNLVLAPELSFNYTFTEPGSFTMDVVIQNFFNQVQIYSNVSIIERLQGLEIQHNCFQDFTEIFCSLANNCIFSAYVQHGIPTHFQWTTNFTNAADTNNVTFSFQSIGIYCINVTFFNSISSLSKYFCIEAQAPILNLKILSNSTTIATNEVVRLEAAFSSGSDVQYLWSCETCTEIYDTSFISHSFSETGIYEVFLEACNSVSTKQANITIYVADLDIISDLASMNCAEVSRSYTFYAVVSGVTTNQIEWTFEHVSTLLSAIKTGQNVSYAFDKPGSYNVKLSAVAGDVTLMKDIVVRSIEPISNLQLEVDWPTAPTLPTNEMITFHAKVDSGTDIQYVWSFTLFDVYFVNQSSYSYSFQNLGSYLVIISASNHHSFPAAHAFLNVTLIEGVSDVILLIDNSTSSFFQQNKTITLSAHISRGSDIEYTWKIEGELYEDSLIEYIFLEARNYTVELVVKNPVSEITTIKTIVILEKPKNLKWISKNWTAQVDVDIELVASLDYGSNITFSWIVVNEDERVIYNVIDTSMENTTRLSINRTIAGNYTVTVTAANMFGSLKLTKVLSLLESISDLSIICNKTVPVNTTQIYQVTINSGTSVTYLWHFAINTQHEIEMISTGDVVYYLYPTSGTFLVEVEAKNAINSVITSEYIQSVEKITSAVLVASAELLLVNMPVTLSVTCDGGSESYVQWDLDNGNGVFNSSTAVQNVTYKTPGIHTITVVCQNDISKVTAFLNISVIDCQLPELQIMSSTPSTVFRSQRLHLEYNIFETLCTSLVTEYKWTVFRNSCSSDLPPEQISLPLETSLPSLKIPGNTLEYGIYCFQLSVTFKETPSENTASSVVKVTATPIVAVINGGHLRHASSQKLLELDGSESFDPDLVGDQKQGLKFQWVMCNSEQVSDQVVEIDAMPIPNLCNKENWTEAKISARLDPLKVYVFILTVTKGSRESVINQTVNVVDGRIPDVHITCVSCQSSNIISASQRLELIGGCSNCNGSNYIFKWTAIQDDKNSIQLNELSTTTGNSSSNLVVKSGILSVSSLYTFQLVVDGDDFDEEGLAEVRYTTNTPPIGGSCSALPLESVAMETLVTISCEDWFDPDSPSEQLLYIMQIMDLGKNNGGVESTLLYYGSRNTYETYLPLGGNQGTETLDLVVYIQDNQGAAVESLHIPLYVTKPKLTGSTTIEWMNVHSRPRLIALQQASDPQRVLDYATTMASVLNEEPQESDEIEDRVNLREAIINATASCPCNDVKDLSHISTTLAIVTAIPEEIVHQATFSTILSSLDTLLSILAETTDDGLNVDEVTSNAMLKIISNTMSALNSENLLLASGISSLDPEFKMEAINNLLIDTERLLDSIMSSQIVHEESLTLKSETITVSAKRTLPSEISTFLEESGTYFRVPETILSNLPRNVEIFEEFILYSQNPYTVGNITTKVSQLEYKFINGTKIPVNNLDNIQMLNLGLPQATSDIVPEINYIHEVNPGETTYISINYEQDVSLLGSFVEVVLTASPLSNANGYFSLMIGLEEEPSLATSVKAVNLTFDLASTSMDYTFLVIPEPATPVTAHHITATNHYNFICNISVSSFQQSCQYYDVHEETWASYGCQAVADSSRDMAECSCNHMTSFGASVQVVPSDIKFKDLKDVDIKSNPVALIVCCTILFLYGIAMVLAWYYDTLNLKFISVVPICGKNGAYCYDIYVKTGERIGSGTSAHIGISIYGSNGKTGSRHLLSKTAFKRNMSATFRIYSECNLENIEKIRVWHDNTGLDPSWYLATIVIADSQTGRRFHFVCETWLSLMEDNGAVEKTFQVLGDEEMKKFSTIFQIESKQQLANQHLWLSVVDRPQQSRFTRTQRVTCCLVLIYTYMCVNAVWYGLLSESGDGSLIVVALATGIIVFPFNFCVALAFIRTKYKYIPNAYKNMPRSAETVEVDVLCKTSQTGDSLFSAGSFASQTTTGEDSRALDLKHDDSVMGDFEMKDLTVNAVSSSKPLDGATLRPLNEQGRWWSTESILGWPEQLPPYNKSENIEMKKLSSNIEEKTETLPPGVVIVEPSFCEEEKIEEPKKELSRGKSMRKGIKTLKKSSNMLRTQSLDDLTNSDDEFWQSLLEEEGVSKETTQSAKEYSQHKKNSTPLKQSDTDLLAPKTDATFTPRAAASLVKESKTRIISSDEGIGHTDSSCTLPDITTSHDKAKDAFPSGRKVTKSSTCTKKYLLPSWFVYINYSLCFTIVILCGIVVLLYGSQFGEEVAGKWIITSFLSLTISMLLLEPLKVLLFALYSASAYESIDSCYSNNDNVIDNPIYEHQELLNCARIVRPPQGFGLIRAKEEGRKLVTMNAMLRHLWVFIMLFTIVMVICYLRQNQSGIDTVSVMKDVYVNAMFGDDDKTFNSIQMFEDFWIWVEKVFARNCHSSDFEDIDYYGNLLGVARLRQIRSDQEKCKVEESNKYKEYFDEVCYGSGTSYSEDRGVFVSQNLNWTYKTSEELNGMSVIGQIGRYSGGGFVQDLAMTYDGTIDILQKLKQEKWLDQQTRAVFVEATFYNVNINVYSVLVLLIELPLSSGAVPSPIILSAKLDRYSQETALLVIEILFTLLLTYFIYIQATDLLHCGIRQFFTSGWSVLSVAMVFLGITTICFLVVQAVYSGHVLDVDFDDPTAFANFYRAAFYSDVLLNCYGMLLFVGTLKVLQVFTFSQWLVFFLSVLARCFWLLLAAAVIFLLVILFFSFLGNQLFGTTLPDFQSVSSSILYLYSFIAGASNLNSLLDSYPIWGPLFMSAFFYFCLILTTCLFAAVIINVYRSSRRGKMKKVNFQNESMIEFMIERFKKRLGIIKQKEYRHRVKFVGVDSISTRSLSSDGTFSQSGASQASTTGSGVSLFIPEDKLSHDQLRNLFDRLSPMVDDILEKLESLKLFELEEECVCKELLCRKNMSKGRKRFKKGNKIEKEHTLTAPLKSRTFNLHFDKSSEKERSRRCSDPTQSLRMVKVETIRPKSEELENNNTLYGLDVSKDNSRSGLRDSKTENLCKPAWELS
ncbi:polycystin-1-like [Antedon mediterranea]|uniref:polycystin-1-like n=1 Tax=Antedon mediterranea TaxID=105859 RepID=UPI003AF7440B